VKIGVTGAAGFIGMNFSLKLLRSGHKIVGIDNLQSSYGESLPQLRLQEITKFSSFEYHNLDLSIVSSEELIHSLMGCEVIFHLAAWPGVRQSNSMPASYHRNNVTTFSNMLNAISVIKPRRFFFASSSSVYGDNPGVPSKESDAIGANLKSYYAATKWINEIEARNFPKIKGVHITALRFFTVYGPWGRPDMAYWKFLNNLFKGEEIQLFGEGGGIRNFTFIDDAIDILQRLLDCELFEGVDALNIAASNPMKTLDLITKLAEFSNKTPLINVVPRPEYDADMTWADTSLLQNFVNTATSVNLHDGVLKFYEWFYEYSKKGLI
jgi:UDP-glucuronate 4-epimerase